MCCKGNSEIDFLAIEKDKEITKQLTSDGKRMNEEIRILLLGAGESGKSTIAKQMKIIHAGGFSSDEKLEYIKAVYTNVCESIQSIVVASSKLGVPLTQKENTNFGQLFLEPYTSPLTPELGDRIELFYKDNGVKELIKRRAEYQLLDNTEYYVSEIKRICAKDYIPTEQDILNTRIQTTGVIETSFNVQKGKNFVFVDVGGQRSERKKWMHCFESVSGVLFCVGISAFDQTLYEDNTTNRLHEALKLFHEICMSKWFTNTAIILFLNKDDLFRKKLERGKNINVAFPEYKGSTDYDESIEFLREKFTNVVDPVTEKKKISIAM